VWTSVSNFLEEDEDLVDRTRRVWQPRLGRDLTREDVRQIAENVTGFFTILAEWSRAEATTLASGNGERTASVGAGGA
jgi:hypothetical protein